METDEWDGWEGIRCGWKVVIGGALVDSKVRCLLGAEGNLVGNLNPSPCRDGDWLYLSPPPLKYRGTINGGLELIRGGVEGCGPMRQSCH